MVAGSRRSGFDGYSKCIECFHAIQFDACRELANGHLIEINNRVDVAGGFVDVEDFAVDSDEDRAVWRRGEFDKEVVRERVAVFEDDFRKDFAADTFLLPPGREVAAVGHFFGEAGRKSFSFFTVGNIGGDYLFFGGAESDVYVHVRFGVIMDVNGWTFAVAAETGAAGFAVAPTFATFVFGEGSDGGGDGQDQEKGNRFRVHNFFRARSSAGASMYRRNPGEV